MRIMEHNDETSSDKKLGSRAKSSGPPHRLRGERRSFNVNEAVKSLDLALCRLRKGKILPNCIPNNSQSGPIRCGVPAADMLMDTTDVPAATPGMDNASMMSMNFSHYELMRNLSRSNNSEGAFSDTTNKFVSPMDMSVKREHLERYFRSAEMWSHRHARDGCSSIHVELPEK